MLLSDLKEAIEFFVMDDPIKLVDNVLLLERNGWSDQSDSSLIDRNE